MKPAVKICAAISCNLLFVTIVWIEGVVAAPVDPDDVYWSDKFPPDGTDQPISALAEYGNRLVAGGGFQHAGGIETPGIAVWDGERWASLGTGLNARVNALAVYENMLIAGGTFDSAGGLPSLKVAAWNGQQWLPLGEGFNHWGGVEALTVYDGKLIAGGWFTRSGTDTVEHLAMWNGSIWEELGGGTNGTVSRLQVFGNKLVVAGSFNLAGGVPCNGLAVWDGSQWSAIEHLRSTSIRALEVYEGNLYVGAMISVDSQWTRVAVWDGSTLRAVPDGPSGNVLSLRAVGDKLVVGGEFQYVGGRKANYIATYDGSTWGVFDTSLYANVVSIAAIGDSLYAAGVYRASDVATNGIAVWSDSLWSALGETQAVDRPALAFEIHQNQLMAGGEFTSAANKPVRSIGAWNGSSWSQFGLPQLPYNCEVRALAEYRSSLVIAGDFSFQATGYPNISDLAQSDGGYWGPVGQALFSGSVNDLLVHDDQLIAAGWFSAVAEDTAKYLARWDGQFWSAMGTEAIGEAHALTVFRDTIIAGARFTGTDGTTGTYIAAWDGSQWIPFGGTGPNYYVTDLEVYNNVLFVSGLFNEVDGVHTGGLVTWDGTNWSVPGGGISDTEHVNAFTLYDGHLIAGGAFYRIGNVDARSIASWDGSQWAPLGSGIVGNVTAMSEYENNLVVSGNITMAGGKRSNNFAVWTRSNFTGFDGNEAEEQLPQRLQLAQNYPNPFNPSTTIAYTVPSRSPVSVDVYNLLGQHVRTLLDTRQSAGTYTLTWDGTNDTGEPLASGVYLYRIRVEDAALTRKMILLK